MKNLLTFGTCHQHDGSLASSSALEYSIDAPNDYDFGQDTSIEIIHTGGWRCHAQ